MTDYEKDQVIAELRGKVAALEAVVERLAKALADARPTYAPYLIPPLPPPLNPLPYQPIAPYWQPMCVDGLSGGRIN